MSAEEMEQHWECINCALGVLTNTREPHEDCLGRGEDAQRTCACACPWLLEGGK